MPDAREWESIAKPPRRSRAGRASTLLSTLLFLAAIALAGLALWVYVDERDQTNPPRTPPASQPGQNDLVAVQTALQEEGLDAELGRITVKSDQLTPPGQLIQIEVDEEEIDLYAFIYTTSEGTPGVALREEAAEDVDPATMTLSSPSKRPVAEGQPLSVYQGSNVIAVLVGGDEATRAKVEAAIEGLP